MLCNQCKSPKIFALNRNGLKCQTRCVRMDECVCEHISSKVNDVIEFSRLDDEFAIFLMIIFTLAMKNRTKNALSALFFIWLLYMLFMHTHDIVGVKNTKMQYDIFCEWTKKLNRPSIIGWKFFALLKNYKQFRSFFRLMWCKSNGRIGNCQAYVDP